MRPNKPIHLTVAFGARRLRFRDWRRHRHGERQSPGDPVGLPRRYCLHSFLRSSLANRPAVRTPPPCLRARSPCVRRLAQRVRGGGRQDGRRGGDPRPAARIGRCRLPAGHHDLPAGHAGWCGRLGNHAHPQPPSAGGKSEHEPLTPRRSRRSPEVYTSVWSRPGGVAAERQVRRVALPGVQRWVKFSGSPIRLRRAIAMAPGRGVSVRDPVRSLSPAGVALHPVDGAQQEHAAGGASRRSGSWPTCEREPHSS